MPMIEPSDILSMSAVVLLLTWLGFVVDASRVGKTMPGVVVILTGGLILSNLSIAPFTSIVTEFIGQYIVAAAIPPRLASCWRTRRSS